jgi:PKD repeat protein
VRTTFRQGIARYQTDINGTPTFLQKSTLGSQFIDVIVSPDPTVIVFAHYNANYVVEEAKTIRSAWGPFPTSATAYLYWDIDLLTAQLTRGFTLLPPVFTGVQPSPAALDQHWFDSINNVMKVWNGNKWIDKIRVFAATYASSAVIKPYPLGTQAGINGDFEAGNLILDSYFKPLRQSDGSFVTSTTDMSVVSVATKKVRFEAEISTLLANEYIPKFSCVQIVQGRRTILGRSGDVKSRIVGIATEDMYAGETALIATGGLLRNDQWTWPTDKINRPLFCGLAGELTLVPPTTGVLQQVGFVYDVDAIYVRVFPPIILDDPYSVLTPPPPPGPNPTAPTANFTIVPFNTVGTVPFTVQFQDLSINGATSWEWDFTNDGTVDSTVQNPSYTFAAAGTYNVRLRAINAYGWDDEIKVGYITVNSAAPPATNTNLGVTLTAQNQVQRNQLFTLTMTVRNAGHLTATMISRTVYLPDVDGNQVVPSGLPPTANVTRDGKLTVVALPPIASMIGGASVPISFTVQALPKNGEIAITAKASSPEIDANTNDNTASIEVEVRS